MYLPDCGALSAVPTSPGLSWCPCHSPGLPIHSADKLPGAGAGQRGQGMTLHPLNCQGDRTKNTIIHCAKKITEIKVKIFSKGVLSVNAVYIHRHVCMILFYLQTHKWQSARTCSCWGRGCPSVRRCQRDTNTGERRPHQCCPTHTHTNYTQSASYIKTLRLTNQTWSWKYNVRYPGRDEEQWTLKTDQGHGLVHFSWCTVTAHTGHEHSLW